MKSRSEWKWLKGIPRNRNDCDLYYYQNTKEYKIDKCTEYMIVPSIVIVAIFMYYLTTLFTLTSEDAFGFLVCGFGFTVLLVNVWKGIFIVWFKIFK